MYSNLLLYVGASVEPKTINVDYIPVILFYQFKLLT